MMYSLLGFYLNWCAYNVFTEGHPRRWEVTLNLSRNRKKRHNGRDCLIVGATAESQKRTLKLYQ